MRYWIVATIAALGLTACASLPPPVPVQSMAAPAGQTNFGHSPGNPTFWPGGAIAGAPGLARDGFIATAAPAGGLAILSFDGRLVQRLEGPRLSDVEVAALPLADNYAVLIAGPVRAGRRTSVAFHRLDPGEGRTVRRWGDLATDLSEPRGFCMRQEGAALRAVVFDRRGDARVFDIAEAPDGALAARELRRFRVDGPGHGCAIDPLSRRVYVSLAGGGFAVTSLSQAGEVARLRDPSPRRLPRSLGVSFLTDGPARYLVSLDEDRAAYSVWDLGRGELRWIGRFAVLEDAGPAMRALEGVDAYGGTLDAFPGGVVIVQGRPRRSRLTVVDWATVRAALAP